MSRRSHTLSGGTTSQGPALDLCCASRLLISNYQNPVCLTYLLGQLLQCRDIELPTDKRAVGAHSDAMLVTPFNDRTLLVKGV